MTHKIAAIGAICSALCIPSAASADELLAVGSSLDDFQEFLSQPTVKMRSGTFETLFTSYRYELIRGQIVEDGCRYNHVQQLSGQTFKASVAIEIAHDHFCQSLSIVGMPTAEYAAKLRPERPRSNAVVIPPRQPAATPPANNR